MANEEVLVADAPCNDLVVTNKGLYYTDPANKKLHFVTLDGTKTEVDSGIAAPNGLIVSPDQTLLHVADSEGRFTYSFSIAEDGTLLHKQEYGYLHAPDATTRTAADGMSMDVNGNLYVATSVGLQILDPLGRVNQILPKPQNAFLSNVAFGGPERNVLVVTCGDKVYRRKVNAVGSVSWETPTKPPKPGL
jgi:sugar lactone lactonase YvrE